MKLRSLFRGLLALLFALGLGACSTTVAEKPADQTAEEAPEITQEEALAAFDEAWGAVYEYHYDPEFNGVDWVALKDELRPKAAEARTEDEVRAIINDMVGRLGQSHFAVIPVDAIPEVAAADPATPERLAGGLGLDVRLRDGALLINEVRPDGPADRAGVRTGWILNRVGVVDLTEAMADLQDAKGLGERQTAYTGREIALHTTYGTVGSEIELALLDGDGQEVTLTVEREERNVIAHNVGMALPTFYLHFDKETLDRDGKRVGVIHFTNWFLPMMKPIDEAVDEMRGHEGIIIDLRGNSGGALAMVMGIAGHFFDEEVELGVQTMRQAQLNVVALPRFTNSAGELVEPYAGPVAILVDETSASASEVFSGGMQSVERVRVFGETTAGAVLPARTTILPNGDALLHALGDFKTADGTLLEGRGVIPDETVPLVREDLLSGRDRQLEAALDWVVSQ